jgi:hypothetical protein
LFTPTPSFSVICFISYITPFTVYMKPPFAGGASCSLSAEACICTDRKNQVSKLILAVPIIIFARFTRFDD